MSTSKTGSLNSTIAVLSDLHAFEGPITDTPPSHLCTMAPAVDPGKNPIAGLKALINERSLTADVVLCAGDLADKAHPAALRSAWSSLQEVRIALGANHLFATTGNHDIDSRFDYNGFDAKGVLQTLDPPYPFPQAGLNDQYWARHFAITEVAPVRFLILNSSAFHGEGRLKVTGRHEYEHGRVSDYTLTALRTALEAAESPLFNVLLCHHHPHQHSELGLGEDDLMAGGQKLLDLLGSGRCGQWLIVHGHKHHPKLENAAGSSAAPWVLAAGSFSANLHLELQTSARNQFYLLDFSSDLASTQGFVGRFQAWDWYSGQGWIGARDGSGLPHKGGFGWRGQVPLLARRIADHVDRNTCQWDELTTAFPELSFVAPSDLRHLCDALLQDHRLIAESSSVGTPFQIGPEE